MTVLQNKRKYSKRMNKNMKIQLFLAFSYYKNVSFLFIAVLCVDELNSSFMSGFIFTTGQFLVEIQKTCTSVKPKDNLTQFLCLITCLDVISHHCKYKTIFLILILDLCDTDSFIYCHIEATNVGGEMSPSWYRLDGLRPNLLELTFS